MFQQAIKKFRQVGNRDGIATALSNFADARLSQGNLKEARKLLEEAITEYQAIDDQEGIALNFDSLGDVSRQTGELDRSESAYKRAESVARKIDDKDATAYVLNGMGDLALDRGDLASARKFYEEALGLRIQAGENRPQLKAAFHWRNLPLRKVTPQTPKHRRVRVNSSFTKSIRTTMN